MKNIREKEEFIQMSCLPVAAICPLQTHRMWERCAEKLRGTKKLAWIYTLKANTIASVNDGSRAFSEGRLMCVTRLSDEMKVAAANALAGFMKNLKKDQFLPQVLNRDIVNVMPLPCR